MFKAVETMQENNSKILKNWRCISTNVLKYELMRYFIINTMYAHMFGFLHASLLCVLCVEIEYADSEGADEHAHPRSLISTFIVG